MSFEIRKIVSYVEETFIEGGKAADTPVKMVGLAVVLKNPWLGRGFVEDLKPEIRANCSDLGALMVERLVGIIGGAENIEAYGKRRGRCRWRDRTRQRDHPHPALRQSLP